MFGSYFEEGCLGGNGLLGIVRILELLLGYFVDDKG